MQIRYAVAGKPIQHSLSPVLAVLTATHLKQAGLEVQLEEINLLESDDVTSPMAWAWVKKNRQKVIIESIKDMKGPKWETFKIPVIFTHRLHII